MASTGFFGSVDSSRSAGSPLFISIAGAALLAAFSASIFYLPALPQIIVLLAVLVTLYFFTQPEVSLLVFFALRMIFDLLWWIPGEVFGLNMLELFSGAVAGLAAVLFILEFRRFDDHPGIALFVPYLAVMGIAAGRNLDVRSAVEILARYVSPFLIMFLVTYYFGDRRKRRRLFITVSAVGVIPVILSLFHLASGQMEAYELAGYQRLQGAYKNLHNHALMMMLVSTIGLFWILQSRRFLTRMLFVVVTLAAGLALYYTFVRTALLGLAGFLIVYLLFARHFRTTFMVMLFGVSLVLYDDSLRDRFADIFVFFSDDGAYIHKDKLGSGRWGLWKYSFQAYAQYPLGDMVLGLGLGKQWLLTQQYYDEYASARFGYVDPHNDYLTLLYQLGPVAVICYIGQQYLVLRYAYLIIKRRFDRFSYYYAAFCAGLCVTAMLTNFLSNAFVSRTTLGWYFWGFVGLLYGEWRSIQAHDRAAALDSPPTLTPATPGGDGRDSGLALSGGG